MTKYCANMINCKLNSVASKRRKKEKQKVYFKADLLKDK